MIAVAGLLEVAVTSPCQQNVEHPRAVRQTATAESATAQAREAQESGGEAEKPRAVSSQLVWRDRPSFRFGESLRVDIRARFQGDFRRSYDGADIRSGLTTFELSRRRVGIEGTAFRHVEFEVERDVSAQALTAAEVAEGITPRTPWKDVYVDLDYIRRAQLRVGRFKIPFGRDELTSIASNDFVYRSLGALYLAPSRDTGLMAHGRVFDRGLNYWVGLFDHDGDNARSKKIRGGNLTVAARVTATPFRPVAPAALRTVELGVAFAESALSAESFRPNGLRGRTVVTEDTFLDSVYVSGRRSRWEADVEWLLGPSSLRAEYTRVADGRLGQGARDEDLPDVRYRSWYVSGTYLVTGEPKRRPVRPRAAFLDGGAGAVELGARYERIWYDSAVGTDVPSRSPRAETIVRSGDRVLTFAINWILNRWIVLQANGIRERVEDQQRSPTPDGAPFWSRVLRVQFVL